MAGYKELTLAIQVETHFRSDSWEGFEPPDFMNLVETFVICGRGAADTAKLFQKLSVDEVIARTTKVVKLNSILKKIENNALSNIPTTTQAEQT